MASDDSPRGRRDPAAVVVGYLNFSSGAFDPTVWRAMSDLYAAVEPPAADGAVVELPDAADRVRASLARRLDDLEAAQPAFRDAGQARRMLGKRAPSAQRASHSWVVAASTSSASSGSTVMP